MLANKDPRSAPCGSDSSIFAIFSASFLVSGDGILLLLVRQQVDVVHYADDRRIDSSPRPARSGGRGRPAFLGNDHNVAFTGIDGIEGDARIVHILAIGRDLAAEHRACALVT